MSRDLEPCCCEWEIRPCRECSFNQHYKCIEKPPADRVAK